MSRKECKVKLKKIGFEFFIIVLMFQNTIFNIFPFPSFFGFWDESLEILLFIYALTYIVVRRKFQIEKQFLYLYLSLLGIIILGFMGNLAYGYMNSINGILRDIITFLKFPLSLIIILHLKLDEKFTMTFDNSFVNVIKFIIILMFTLGVISIFQNIGLSQNEIRYGIKPYQFLFSHPTYLVLNCVYLLAFINSIPNKKGIFKYEIMTLIIIILTMRTKGIVIIVLYIFIKSSYKWLMKFKFLYWGGIIGLTIYTSYSKLMLYSSYNSSPREALYKGALTLVGKCFPFGSGFGTFASSISSNFNSAVYRFVNIPYYWTGTGNENSVLGDAGLAYYIGQFGLFGSILLVYVSISIYKILLRNVKNKLPILLLLIYIAIAIPTEALLANCGFEYAVILAYVACLNRE